MPLIPSSSTWSSNLNLNLAMLSYSIGLTIPRASPWLLRTQIGVPLLIPVVLLVTLLVCTPYIFMELALGQYSNKATIRVWDLCPALRGVGYCSFLIFLVYQTYYTFLCNCSLCFALFTFSEEPVWKSCNKTWNKINCFTLHDNFTRRFQCNEKFSVEKCEEMTWQSSVEQFYLNRILNMSDSGGIPQQELLVYALITMVLVFCSNYGGPKTTEKILMLLAIVPSLQILILFFHPLVKPHASLLLHHLFTHFDKTPLKDSKTWTKLLEMSLSTSGLGFGVFTTFGTHFSFRSSLHIRAIGISLTSVFFTLLYTIVLQNFLMSLCFQSKMFMQDLFSFEQELALPEAAFFLDESSRFWTTMWLSSSYFLGLRSLVVMMTINAEVIYDTVPGERKRHNFYIFSLCVFMFSFGIFYSTRTGYKVLKVVEKMTNEFSLVVLNMLNLVGVVFLYGIRRFRNDLFFMLGIKPSFLLNVLYVLSPMLLSLVFINNVYEFYHRKTKEAWIYKLQNCALWFGLSFILIYALLYALVRISRKQMNFVQPAKKWVPKDETLTKSREMFDVYTTSQEYLYRQNHFRVVDNEV